jgi:hypothetical protein
VHYCSRPMHMAVSARLHRISQTFVLSFVHRFSHRDIAALKFYDDCQATCGRSSATRRRSSCKRCTHGGMIGKEDHRVGARLQRRDRPRRHPVRTFLTHRLEHF